MSNLISPLKEEWEKGRPFFSTQPANGFYANSVHLVGFCFDGTTSFRPGARFGPEALRDAAFGIETYSPYLNKELEDLNILDLGNLPIYPSNWKKMNDIFHAETKELNLKQDQIKLITLGGEHSISYGPIRLHLDNYSDLFILHLDAHADLRDGYLDEKYSHASIIRRCLDHMDSSNDLLQYGIRSGTKQEFEYMKEHNTRVNSLEECLDRLNNVSDSRPIYLTLDLDFFDPAYLPGTGTPETGGESFHSFMKILKILNQKNFVGADIVELAPMIDPTGNSSVFAAKVVRETILALS